LLGRRCAAADFSKNLIGPQGCTQLCQVLTSNTGLQTLLLDTNALGDEGAAMLATVSWREEQGSRVGLGAKRIDTWAGQQARVKQAADSWQAGVTVGSVDEQPGLQLPAAFHLLVPCQPCPAFSGVVPL
jgi:hypothetical protein